MSVETKERIIKLLKEGKSSRNVAKDVGCSQSGVSKIWTKYKQHGKVVKGKHTGKRRKTSKRTNGRKLESTSDRTLSLTPKQKRTRLQWTKEKQSQVIPSFLPGVVNRRMYCKNLDPNFQITFVMLYDCIVN
uniref:Uncharacterized protein n=1 Tax=Gouania willdenowi TaxID=441366 RepID=A0A8C5GL78_GOUWI